MVELSIELDARQLEAWASQTVKQVVRQLRSAVDRSARYARAQTLPVLAADMNVPLARFRSAVPPVRGSSAGSLEARWYLGNAANSVRGPGGESIASVRGEPIQGSTFAVTGGGSANLTLAKGFVIKSGKGQVIMIRLGPGKSNIRAVYAESPASAFKQPDSAPRKAWEAAGERSLSLLVVAGVQAALDGQSSTASVPGMPAGDAA